MRCKPGNRSSMSDVLRVPTHDALDADHAVHPVQLIQTSETNAINEPDVVPAEAYELDAAGGVGFGLHQSGPGLAEKDEAVVVGGREQAHPSAVWGVPSPEVGGFAFQCLR